MLSEDSVKNQAKVLKSFLSEKFGDVSYSSCLEAIAKINGFKGWNTMQSIIKTNGGVGMSNDIVERLNYLEDRVIMLTEEIGLLQDFTDEIHTKVGEHEPYILGLQGIDPWNPSN